MSDDPAPGPVVPTARRRFVAFGGRTPAWLVPTGLFRAILYGVATWAIGRVAFDRTAFGSGGSSGRYGWLLVAATVVCAAAFLVNVARVVVGVRRFLSSRNRSGR